MKDSPEDLVSDPFTFRASTGTDGQGTWFLPMRRAVVDSEGHLHLANWKQNDLAKGGEMAVDASQNSVRFPPGQTATNPIVRVESDRDAVLVHTDKNWRAFPWLESDKTRKAIVVLNQRFDLDAGLIIEGQVNAKKLTRDWGDARQTYAGFYIEGTEKNTGTGIMLQVGEPQWREVAILFLLQSHRARRIYFSRERSEFLKTQILLDEPLSVVLGMGSACLIPE